MWDGSHQDVEGYTMPKYSMDDLHELKKGCLWWLVTHPENVHSTTVLAMLGGKDQKKKK